MASGADRSRTGDLLNAMSTHPLHDRARRGANGHFIWRFAASVSPLATHRGPDTHYRTTAAVGPRRRHTPALLPDRIQPAEHRLRDAPYRRETAYHTERAFKVADSGTAEGRLALLLRDRRLLREER